MRLNQDEILVVHQASSAIGVEYAALLAGIQVESGGIAGYNINGRLEPAIRWEGHYFDKLINPAKREQARAAGLSSPEAGKIKNPKNQVDRWALLMKAVAIDPVAAYESVSYGVGQVMGANWKKLGFDSVLDLVNTARKGFSGQVRLMVQYILNFGLLDELKNKDWSGFARGYNGPNFKKYSYDTNLLKAYIENGGTSALAPHVDGLLRLGSKGAGVRDIQALLRSAGYQVTVDGDFGTSTKAAVVAFQKRNGLTADGMIGPKTQAALNTLRENAPEKPGAQKLFSNPTVQKAVAVGVGTPTLLTGAKNTVQGYIDQVSAYSFMAPVVEHLTTIVGVLTVVGIGATIAVAAYKWWESKQTSTGTKAEHFPDPIIQEMPSFNG